MVLARIGTSLARVAPRIGATLGGSRATTAGAGLAGGVLLDDIPFLSSLDPTEGGSGGNQWVIIGLLILGVLALGSLFEVEL